MPKNLIKHKNNSKHNENIGFPRVPCGPVDPCEPCGTDT